MEVSGQLHAPAASKVQVKVKLSQYLIKHHALEICGGLKVLLDAFLTSEHDAGKWFASLPGNFNPGKELP
jgi:hypothetical protein